jgi:hypothetical protein
LLSEDLQDGFPKSLDVHQVLLQDAQHDIRVEFV